MNDKISVSKRIKSIDIIRGLSVALMIIGNNPGSWARNYPQLRHSLWNGVTLVDFVFPFFILAMSVSIPIAIENKFSKEKSTGFIIGDIIKRSLILIIFGILLNYISNNDLKTIRIPGVLQRLGFVYFVTSIIYITIRSLTFRKKLEEKNFKEDDYIKNYRYIIVSLLIIVLAIVVSYYFIAKPYGFFEEGNLAQKVDTMILNGHLYNERFDPEGILTNIVAISTGCLGCALGCIIKNNKKDDYKKLFEIIIIGVVCLIGAFLFERVFPFNKRLWSSSFVLLTGGAFGVVLGILYFISDIKEKYKIFTPLIALGSSAIFTYMALEIIDRTLWMVSINSKMFEEPLKFCNWVTYTFITPWAGQVYDSLIFSLGYLLVWIIIMMFMYRKKIFIRI
ncbi:DUF5009 domain-containing protein [Romboutsia maritimum]|uniref:DUF5009 domain-containing protein n=1 Tax=Romboutsia maritimum TaxID=2020948 RepID=A0A371IRZ3_9FIRM|nr:DUF5009 domain-containing protein [Romboutsia maritimum]RDY23256.1 DUF5009 domain-containing protein [Romboutsia maritimum]